MIKAFMIWKGGRSWWEVMKGRDLLEIVATVEEAAIYGATEFIATPEPRFLVVDHSGRGCRNEVFYTDFTAEEREYKADEDDENCETFGEWLDDVFGSSDEFDNSDDMYTVHRIN